MKMAVRRIGLLMAFLMAACMLRRQPMCAAAAANSWKIECAAFNAPELRAYLYGADKWDSIAFTSAFLTTQTGEVRNLEYESGKLLAQAGEGTEYIYLVDVSGSMKDANIAVIKKQILEHLDTLSGKDRLIVYVFGGRTEKIADAAGSLAKAKKAKVKNAVEKKLKKGKGSGRGSAVYSAMETVMDFTAGQDAKQKKNVPLRKVCLLLTDGVDRDFGSVDQLTFEEKIRESHTAFYGIGLSMQNASAENQAGQERGFSQLGEYCAASGGDWTSEPDNEQRVYKALRKKREGLASCFVVQFRAENNQVSNAEEVLTITSEDNRSSTRTILANKYQADQDAPKVEKLKKTADNAISFAFSEAVKGTDKARNFTVKNRDGESMKIKSVSYDDSSYKCEIVFQDKLYSGKYTLKFKNIVDYSMEQNPVEGVKFDFDGKSAAAGGIAYVLIHFWWVILLAALAAAASILYKKLNEQGGVVVVDGKASMRNHLAAKSEPKMNIHTKSRDLYMIWEEADGKTSDIRIQIDSSIFVGRASICNIVVDDPMISKQHFVIEDVNGAAYISDLNTKNGTFVNGARITNDHLLQGNDRIRAGMQTFVFCKIQ